MNGPFEEKNACGTVGNVPVHTGVRLQTVDAAKKIIFLSLSAAGPSRHSDAIHSFLGAERR